MGDWYRGRPFKVAVAVSVVIHATLIAFIPGFRAVPIDLPRVLEVEIAPQEAPLIPVVPDKPVILPRIVEPRIERAPEPVVRLPQPEPPPAPRADIIQVPRAEPKPEFALPKPESRPEPPPVARVEPVPEPRPEPRAEPKQEPLPEPPPVVPSRVEPAVVAPPVAQPLPQQATVPPPPVVQPQPKMVDDGRERALTDRYRQIISAKIKQHEEYPQVAKRRHWEGTTVVQLQFTPEGRVADISVVEKSGHDILDEAAVKMIRNAAPLPIPPEGLRTVLVPIKFRLDS